MQGMDLEGWQEYERQQRAELEEQRQRLKSAIVAVTSGDKAAQAALEKAMMPEDEAEQRPPRPVDLC